MPSRIYNSKKKPENFRLNKYVAHCGICSRRKAAELIKKKKVMVNGVIMDNPAYIVQAADMVSYLGKRIQPEKKKVYILMNKPKNVVTTVSDEKARKTVIDIITPKVKERVYPVGRLDRNTTGLLLLTNDGDLAKKLSHPSHKVQKLYQVELNKPVKEADIKTIKRGLILEDGIAKVDFIRHVENKPENIVQIEIHMGKNRIVRRIFEHFNYEVVRLDRIIYAGLTKKDLPRGWFRPLKKKEVIMLKHFI